MRGERGPGEGGKGGLRISLQDEGIFFGFYLAGERLGGRRYGRDHRMYSLLNSIRTEQRSNYRVEYSNLILTTRHVLPVIKTAKMRQIHSEKVILKYGYIFRYLATNPCISPLAIHDHVLT